MIAPLLYVAAVTGHTIVDVRTWIHRFDIATPIGLLEEICSILRLSGRRPVRAMSMLESVDQRPERERGTVFSTVMRIFNVFTDRRSPNSAIRADSSLMISSGHAAPSTSAPRGRRQSALQVSSWEFYDGRDVRICYYPERDPSCRQYASLGLFLDELANVVPIEDLPALASKALDVVSC